jgi:hypothetical protein
LLEPGIDAVREVVALARRREQFHPRSPRRSEAQAPAVILQQAEVVDLH